MRKIDPLIVQILSWYQYLKVNLKYSNSKVLLKGI